MKPCSYRGPSAAAALLGFALLVGTSRDAAAQTMPIPGIRPSITSRDTMVGTLRIHPALPLAIESDTARFPSLQQLMLKSGGSSSPGAAYAMIAGALLAAGGLIIMIAGGVLLSKGAPEGPAVTGVGGVTLGV